MNPTLQCLIHIPELSLYFLNEYPNDKKVLNYKNISVKSKGQLSEAYYEVVKGVKNSYSSYSPKTFKQILGRYNFAPADCKIKYKNIVFNSVLEMHDITSKKLDNLLDTYNLRTINAVKKITFCTEYDKEDYI